MSVTTDKLTQIQARADAATEGPWGITAMPGDLHGRTNALLVQPVRNGTPGGVVVAQRTHRHGEGDGAYPDAEFIAHARQDVPALVNALQAVLTLANKWGRCSCDPAENEHRPDCQTYYGHTLRDVIEEALP